MSPLLVHLIASNQNPLHRVIDRLALSNVNCVDGSLFEYMGATFRMDHQATLMLEIG